MSKVNTMKRFRDSTLVHKREISASSDNICVSNYRCLPVDNRKAWITDGLNSDNRGPL